MTRVRPPAVAGNFYPAEPEALAALARGLLREASGRVDARSGYPRALVVPHAAYQYSGAVAAAGYALLAGSAAPPRRVLLLGPAHFVPLRGLALPDVDALETPLGLVELDREGAEALLRLPQVALADAPHTGEHSIEVQLPFLQVVLGEFSVVPVVVGEIQAAGCAAAIAALWDAGDTSVVVSSDLSHYLGYAQAKRTDAATARAIESLDRDGIGADSACGARPLSGLLEFARERGLRARTVELGNSGDAGGGHDRVVGYGAFALS